MMLAAGITLALPVQADEVADFYKGKTITFTAASGVGGGYGVYAMLIREHLRKYIPGNPNVIVTYNPGGGGVVAADYHYNVAPKDGTAILLRCKARRRSSSSGAWVSATTHRNSSGSAGPPRPPAASWSTARLRPLSTP